MTNRAGLREDADALLVRRTAIRVGGWITAAVAVLVIAVLVAAISFVFRQVLLVTLFDPNRHEETIDVGGLDVIVGGIALGVLGVAAAGTLGLLATRRAVAPLVDALARQRRFVADASHELRTPLSILDARLQLLERALPADDPSRPLVDELRRDSRNVINVVNDLLDSVDIAPSAAVAPERLAPIVDGAAESMRLIGDERGIRIDVEPVATDLATAIPATSLHRALVAVIDNALKHSPDGGVVVVSTGVVRGRPWISVTDHGAGIRGIDPEQIFDRFARSSLAVDGGGSASIGFGIGLSLVQDTLGRFGGTVEVSDTSANGTTITMRLPPAKR